jgi:hypothetical protein
MQQRLDLTSYSQYNYNKNDFHIDGSYADNLGSISSSVNKSWEMTLLDSINPGKFLNNVGFYTQGRNPDEDRFLRMLLAPVGVSGLATDTNVTRAVRQPGVKNYTQQGFNGVKLEYMPVDNGDQLRKFGRLIVDAVDDSGFRMVVTQYSLDTWNANNGDEGAVEIPAATNLNEEMELYISPERAGYFAPGGCECAPLRGKCANSFRRIYVIKKRNFTPGSQTLYSQGVITDQVPQDDGGLLIKFILGTGQRGHADAPGAPVNYLPESGQAVSLEVGDVIMFGTHTPTTQCLPEHCCTKATPKVFKYCSTAEQMTDCVYTDEFSDVLLHKTDELNYAEKAAYKVAQQMRDFVHRVGNNFQFSDTTHAAGQRRPIPVEGDSESYTYNNCDVIARTNRGIFPTIERYSNKFEHYFTGCTDSCGQFKIAQIFESLKNNMQGLDVYNTAGWMLVGDAKPLIKYQHGNRAYNDVIPNNYEEAQKIRNMRASTYDPNAKSMFGDTFNPDNRNVDFLEFGGKKIQAIHDDTLAEIYPGTLWFVNMKAFTFFAPDVDGLVARKDLPVASNPYFPATAKRGILAPYIYTQDLAPTVDGTGAMTLRTKRNCGLKYNAFMWAGLHVDAPFLPHMAKFTYGVRTENPDFNEENPVGPNNLPYIYKNLEDADCECSSAESAVRRSFIYWTNTER